MVIQAGYLVFERKEKKQKQKHLSNVDYIYQMSTMCHMLSFAYHVDLHDTPAVGTLLIPA